MTSRHYFIAIPLPEKIKDTLYEWRLRNESSLHFKSWVHPMDYHITLAFLGKVEGTQFNQIHDAMLDIVKEKHPFSLACNHVGTFGLTEKPRILWVGLEENVELRQMQKSVHSSCKNIGFSLDNRPYSPHITLARRWNSEDTYKQLPLFQERLTFQVEEILLYETHIEKTPKYHRKLEWKLR